MLPRDKRHLLDPALRALRFRGFMLGDREDGLPLASLNWILASLANHGFVTIRPSNDRRLRAAATKAGHLALEMRPLPPEGVLNIH
jgi:hypothetical protein